MPIMTDAEFWLLFALVWLTGLPIAILSEIFD